MPNRNYVNGRAKEYRIIKQLKAEGFDITQRSCGSHSPIDVFAISKADKKILLVQSKPKSMSDRAKEKLLKDNAWLNGSFSVEFIVE